MKRLSQVACFTGILACLGTQAVIAQTAEKTFDSQWVEYSDRHISVAFDRIPVGDAVRAIREKTGFQFSLPPSADSKFLNLRLERSPLEPAVYSFLSNIGFRSFALIYDENGRPHRAVVLGAEVDDPTGIQADASEATAPTAQPLNPEERDALQKDLDRWTELKQEQRGRIEDRLKNLPASEEREELVKEYGRKLLGIKK